MSDLKPEHKALFADKRWQLHTHLKFSSGSSYVWKCLELRITRVVANERKKGKYSSKQIFLIDGDDREFADVASLADALLERNARAAAKEAS